MPFVPANVAQFTFEVAGFDRELRVVRLTGNEALSQLFRFTLELASEEPEIDFGAVVGKGARLILLGDSGERFVNGMVSRFEQTAERGRFTLYQAELVPHLWLLAFRHRSRIFQQRSVPDIIKQILEEVGLTSDRYRFVLQKEYPPREYCVQYRETDLQFISRLMEEEGIFYFFEHTEEKHVLVMADAASAHVPIAEPPAVIFHEPTGTVPTEEYVYQYRYAEKVRPGAVVLRDFDFTKPSLTLQAEKQADQDTALEIYDYPGEYVAPERGRALAQVRLEAFQAPRKVGRGSSVCRRFLPGYRFTLRDHPRKSFNQEYVLTRVSHTAAQPQALEEFSTGEGATYANGFSCIPASVPFRPPRVTPRPVVKGSQTAIVVGPKGEEIYTDEHGRVKVQFHWDREGRYDEKSSCWVRVSQGWAGAAWGGICLPRIGQEVIVDFLEGDPDCPLITGRVYNGEHPPPYKLPDEKTKSTLKSNSSKGGKGFNEIRFEDKKGEEQIFIHAEKNQDIRVKKDTLEWVGQDRHLIVKRDQLEKVEGDKHLAVKGDHNEKVDGTISLKAGMDMQEKVGMKHALDAGMEIHLKAGMNVIIEAGMSITLKAGGGFVVVGPAGVTISGTPVLINSGGAAGSGSGSSPEAPQAPKEADTAEPGKKAKLRAAQPAPFAKLTPSPAAFVQAQTLREAAKSGVPFCEKCERAAHARG